MSKKPDCTCGQKKSSPGLADALVAVMTGGLSLLASDKKSGKNSEGKRK